VSKKEEKVEEEEKEEEEEEEKEEEEEEEKKEEEEEEKEEEEEEEKEEALPHTQAKMEEKPKMSHTRAPPPPARSRTQRRSGTPLQKSLCFICPLRKKKKPALTARRLAAAWAHRRSGARAWNVTEKKENLALTRLGALFFFSQPGRTEGAVRARECGADFSR
jgi:hypothetical protein